MPGPTRDSLSRCDSNAYSMYDVRKRPDTNQKPTASTQPIQKDTIEISREKLKKEALNRLQHTSKYMIVQAGFMRVGKYVFLSVGLPPYLLIYAIPKWALTVALPYILSFTMNMVQKTFKSMQKKTHEVVQGIFQKIKGPVMILVQPIMRLVLEIRNAIQRIRHNVAQFFNGFINILKSPGRAMKKGQQKLAGFVKKEFQNFIKGLRRNFDQAQQWLSYPASAFAACVKALNWIKGTPKNILETGKSYVQRINQFFSNVSNFVKTDFNTSRRIAQNITQWLFKYLEGEKRFIKDKATKMKSIFASILQPIKQIKDAWKGLFIRMLNHLKQLGNQLNAGVERGLAYLKALSRKQFFASSEAFSGFPKFMRQFLMKFTSQPVVQQPIQTCFRFLYLMSSSFWTLLNKLLKIIRNALSLVSKGVNELFRYVNLGMHKSLDYSSKGLSKSGKYGRIIFFHTLVVLIMAIIIVIWGMRLLSHITGRILFGKKKAKKAV